mgnify:CR=1 FL=1
MTLLYCRILYAAGLSIGLARSGHRSSLLRPGETPPLSSSAGSGSAASRRRQRAIGRDFSGMRVVRRPGLERRRLAEFGQVISQLLRPGRKKYNPHISFAPPVTLDDLGHGKGEVMPNIKARARALLAEHMAYKW